MILKTIKGAFQTYVDFEKALLQMEMIMGKEKVEMLTISFEVPEMFNRDLEIRNIYIINELLEQRNHSEQHRVLDYFKSKFNVSRPTITAGHETLLRND